MLIPRKMSFRKIAGYGLVMCFTLGTTGYLIYKNFIVPYLGADEAAVPTLSIAGEETFAGDKPAEIVIKENSNIDSKKMAGEPIDIFTNEKFINLKSGGIIEQEVDSQIVGKKNIFEPFNSVKEAADKASESLPGASSSSMKNLSEE